MKESTRHKIALACGFIPAGIMYVNTALAISRATTDGYMGNGLAGASIANSFIGNAIIGMTISSAVDNVLAESYPDNSNN